MNLSEVNWDFEASGTWPTPIKIIVVLVISVSVALIGVYYFTIDQLDELEQLEKKEEELKNSFSIKQKKAVNLPAYKNQLSQIEASLEDMIKQMPTKEEVANLLIDISQTGLASGLEFRLFKPGPPVQMDFYSELPIKIQVIGRYEELGLFVSGLASLPRIVTIHDVDITPNVKDKKDKKLTPNRAMIMNAVVKTYNEVTDLKRKSARAKKKRGKRS
ncbi:MAG: type 4a pilus biogenesis protein PilO [Gammaproteobacteria bacterium]